MKNFRENPATCTMRYTFSVATSTKKNMHVLCSWKFGNYTVNCFVDKLQKWCTQNNHNCTSVLMQMVTDYYYTMLLLGDLKIWTNEPPSPTAPANELQLIHTQYMKMNEVTCILSFFVTKCRI
jgi:hypothetical protein